jgi:hypothetical protein
MLVGVPATVVDLAGPVCGPVPRTWPAILTAASGSGLSERHLLLGRSQEDGPWLPGYWIPATQVPDGLAVLPLDGVFEQVGQPSATCDARDVGDPAGQLSLPAIRK